MCSSVVLYSGGLDSYILLEYVRKLIDTDTRSVYFDIKSKYSWVEKKIIQFIEPDIEIDNSLILGDLETPSAYIPNRNIILTILATSRYSSKVFIGGSLSDRIVDNNKECFDNLSTYLSNINQKCIEITSPFWNVYKEDMVNWYCNNVKDGQEKLLQETFSCYNPLNNFRIVTVKHLDGSSKEYNSFHCFNCPACFRRNAALVGTGYILPFYNSDIITRYGNEFLSKISLEPNNKRTAGTILYLEELKRMYAEV